MRAPHRAMSSRCGPSPPPPAPAPNQGPCCGSTSITGPRCTTGCTRRPSGDTRTTWTCPAGVPRTPASPCPSNTCGNGCPARSAWFSPNGRDASWRSAAVPGCSRTVCTNTCAATWVPTWRLRRYNDSRKPTCPVPRSSRPPHTRPRPPGCGRPWTMPSARASRRTACC